MANNVQLTPAVRKVDIQLFAFGTEWIAPGLRVRAPEPRDDKTYKATRPMKVTGELVGMRRRCTFDPHKLEDTCVLVEAFAQQRKPPSGTPVQVVPKGMSAPESPYFVQKWTHYRREVAQPRPEFAPLVEPATNGLKQLLGENSWHVKLFMNPLVQGGQLIDDARAMIICFHDPLPFEFRGVKYPAANRLRMDGGIVRFETVAQP